MLFNSFVFVLVFLPLSLLAYYVVVARWPGACLVPLIGFSLLFYAWWNPIYLVLLLISIRVNYGLGLVILDGRRCGTLSRVDLAFVSGIIFNLALLGYFKYANFFVDTINQAVELGWTLGTIILPLAISFFTFQQITFLTDTRAGRIRDVPLASYIAFVSFFPQLIAGPIVHYQEVVPQYRAVIGNPQVVLRFLSRNLSVGLTIFAIGLFKKVVLADSVAGYADAPYDAAALGVEITFLEAWAGTIAFTFQIYFDFSGYSDMAIGLARMFGIRLPLNFNAPYKAHSIIEFWRRWHMTLSRFLRDYLYIPLGGGRRGRLRRYVNLMAVMVLGGLWHGAGWTFVIWGTLHGVYLAINHGLRAASRSKPGLGRFGRTALGRLASATLVMVAVMIAWVFFRAADLDTATAVLSTMLALDGLILPETILRVAGPVAPILDALGASYQWTPYWFGAIEAIWFLILFFFVLFLPTTQELMERYRPAIDHRPGARSTGEASVRTAGTVVATAAMLRVAAAMVLLAWVLMFAADLGMVLKLATFGLAGGAIVLGMLAGGGTLAARWRPDRVHATWVASVLTLSLVFLYIGQGKDFLYFQF